MNTSKNKNNCESSNKNNNTRKEQWKDIAGFDGKYQVSNKGRVRTSDGQLLEVKLNKQTKYSFVSLQYNNGNWRPLTVHRLVALAFLPNPNNLEQVDHIDGCRTRNCVSNLRWVSRKFNNSRRKATMLKSLNHQRTSHAHEFVKAVNVKSGEVRYFKNCRQCGLDIGCSHVLAIKVLRGQFKTAKGWKLTYILRDSEEGRNSNVDVSTKAQRVRVIRAEKKRLRMERVKELHLTPSQYKRVVAIDPKTGRVVSIYRNIYAAQTGLHISGVRDAIFGLREMAGGYKWQWLYV